MRIPLCMALCLAAAWSSASAEDQQAPVIQPDGAPSKVSAGAGGAGSAEKEQNQRILRQKLAELRVLQNEITLLGGEIPAPSHRVRISWRGVAIRPAKLKQLGIPHPISKEEPQGRVVQAAAESPNSATKFASEEQMLQTFEPLIIKGCARYIANPTIVAPIGQSTIISSFREVPANHLLDIHGEIFPVPNASEDGTAFPRKTPGFRIEVLPRLAMNDEIELDVRFRINEPARTGAVQLNGHTISGVTSHQMQLRLHLRPGEPTVVGTGQSSRVAQASKTDLNRRSRISTLMNPGGAAESDSDETEFLWIMTAAPVTSNGFGTEGDR